MVYILPAAKYESNVSVVTVCEDHAHHGGGLIASRFASEHRNKIKQIEGKPWME